LRLVTLTKGVLRMYDQQTLPGMTSAISSPVSVGGVMRSDLPVGPTTAPCGPDHALANLSAKQALERGLMTKDTYGRHSAGSSTSDDLQFALENRLRVSLVVTGSPEYALTWKQWDMESGPPICALRASARRTSGNDFGGWPTPDYCSGSGGRVSSDPVAGWVTPSSRDWKDTPGMSQTGTNPDGSTRTRIDQLPRQAAIAGQTQSGFPAPMEKRGVLNPALSRWLMGYPAEWGCCGATAMQLCHKSRKSS
jgi:hypothetical protein